MTEKQEMRAYALAVAVLNNQGSFFNVLKSKNQKESIVEHLEVVENYIENGIRCEVVYADGPDLKNFISN
jgi:hypothetical protein